jgi:hypothetical protein
VPGLLQLLHPTCTLVKTLISDPLSTDFVEAIYNNNGASGFDDSILPLFNCVKVFFQPTGFGRPDYKFVKGFLTEANSTSTEVDPAQAAHVDSVFTALLAAMVTAGASLIAEDGALWTSPSVQSAIQMRQLHRKRKKKVTTP